MAKRSADKVAEFLARAKKKMATGESSVATKMNAEQIQNCDDSRKLIAF